MNEPTTTSPAPDVGYAAEPRPVTATVLPPMSRQAVLVRIGLLGIAAAALVAAALLVMSTSATPNGILAAGTGNGTTGSGNGPVGPFNGLGPGFRGGRGFDAGFGAITITAISGNNISLKTEDGWTRTITVDSGTTYTRAGATIALGDLKVGDEISFRQTSAGNGTWTIDSVYVILPTAGGEVTKISGSTITVSQRDGSTATITVNGQTTYSVNGTASASLSDVKVGMFLVAEGTKNSDGSLTAAQVRAAAASNVEGRGGRFGEGFPFGRDAQPGSSAAPSASGTAS